MADVYSFINGSDDLKHRIQHLEDAIIRITVQTTECGIFIQQWVSDTGGPLDTSRTRDYDVRG